MPSTEGNASREAQDPLFSPNEFKEGRHKPSCSRYFAKVDIAWNIFNLASSIRTVNLPILNLNFIHSLPSPGAVSYIS